MEPLLAVKDLRAYYKTELYGISRTGRAVVAHEALDVLGLEQVSVCPWALREGVILRRLDWLAGA